MDKKVIAALVVVIVIIIIVVVVITTQSKKKQAAIQASCSALNIQTDLTGRPVLCPPNVGGRTWATKGLGSFGINVAGACSADSDYKDCNRCVAHTAGDPAPYTADPLIGLAAGWPNSRYDTSWPSYAGPVTDGQYVGNYQGGIAVADPAPVPAACLA